MEIEAKNRQSVANVKKQATNYANRARFLAQVMNADDKTLRKINSLEQKIQNATLTRKNAKNFCEKEIGQLQLILSDLEKRYTRRASFYELAFSLLVLIENLFVFWGFYNSSIPKGAGQTSSNFFLVLGIITYICLIGIFFLYFRTFKWLSVKFLYPFYTRIYTPNIYPRLYKILPSFVIFSICIFIFRILVLAFATTVPKIFSPSMTFVEFLSTAWTAFIQLFTSSPLVAMATFLTILPFLVIPLKKIFNYMLKK